MGEAVRFEGERIGKLVFVAVAREVREIDQIRSPLAILPPLISQSRGAERMKCCAGDAQRIDSSMKRGISFGSFLRRASRPGFSASTAMVLAVVAAVVSCPAVDMVMKYEMVVRSL